MSRYRKIETRIFGDAKYQALSPQLPSAQTLWLYLIVGPQTTSVPGLFKASEAGLAAELGWPLKEFRRCWREIERAGMARADWAAHVVWLPNAVRYNAPQNPNQVRGWAGSLAEVPECPLKDEGCVSIRAALPDGAAWADAAREVFGETLPGTVAGTVTRTVAGTEEATVPGTVTETSNRNSNSNRNRNSTPLPPKGVQSGSGEEKEAPDPAIPAALDTAEFRDAWARWELYRREKRKALTDSTRRAQLAKLAGWGVGRAIVAIEQSIEKGWTGLFEPKQQPEPAQSASPVPGGTDAAAILARMPDKPVRFGDYRTDRRASPQLSNSEPTPGGEG